MAETVGAAVSTAVARDGEPRLIPAKEAGDGGIVLAKECGGWEWALP